MDIRLNAKIKSFEYVMR